MTLFKANVVLAVPLSKVPPLVIVNVPLPIELLYSGLAAVGLLVVLPVLRLKTPEPTLAVVSVRTVPPA
jgi:hypothetical protein